MLNFFAVICVVLSTTFLCSCTPMKLRNEDIVSREDWGALPPTEISNLTLPVPNVVVHHSSIPAACFNFKECSAAMRSMQYMHQVINGWADIGYNFAVGSDGVVYEGRGWTRVGAHAAGFNTESIGIVLIGHWVSELPPNIQLESAKRLIAQGVRQGYVRKDYSLVGHRQVRETECPGEVLYKEVSTWKHFDISVQLNK